MTLDGIIDIVSDPLMPLIDLLKSHGKLVTVGAPEKPLELLLPPLIMGKNTKLFLWVRIQNYFYHSLEGRVHRYRTTKHMHDFISIPCKEKDNFFDT